MQDLRLQHLESRDVPASGIALQAGILSITGTAGDDQIFVNTISGQTVASLNGATQAFAAGTVSQIVVAGDSGNDRIGNNTALPSVLLGDSGNDSIFGGSGGDFLDGGSGNDVMYDLPGVNTFVSLDGAYDRVFGNAQSLFLSDAQDQQVRFFATGRGPGSGVVSLEGGILYITPVNGGSATGISQVGNQLVVSTTYAGTLTFDISQVSLIAFFGGNGGDIFQNATAIDNLAYGGVGIANDVLFGGGGFNLLKGGGGNDLLVALGANNELMGDGGSDTLVGNGNTFFRSDAADVVVILNDLLFSM